MHLSRYGVERYQPNPSTTPSVDPALWSASFDRGKTWRAAEVVNAQPTWLVAGPKASTPGAAFVLPADVEVVYPALMLPNPPQTIVRDETFTDDEQPPPIWLD